MSSVDLKGFRLTAALRTPGLQSATPPGRSTDQATASKVDELVIAYDRLFSVRFLANPSLDSAFREAWRFQILVFAIHLHDTRAIDDPRAGLTIGRLQALLAGRGIASPGRIAAILKQMEQAGYLLAALSPADRRVTLLSPSPDLQDGIILWEAAIFALIDMVAAADPLAARVPRAPGLGKVMREEIVRARLAGWNPFLGFPELAFFATRDGGWRLVSRLAALVSTDEDVIRKGTVQIDLQDFARAAGASRSTLRRLLEEAWQAGLLDAPPRNGRHIVPSKLLMSEFRRWLTSFIEAHRNFAAIGAERAIQ